MEEFSVSSTVALLPLSLYILGLAFGPVLAAPTSETYGRRGVLLVSPPIFALFILGAGLSKNIASLTICRFLAGLFGSPSLSVGAGMMADLWTPRSRFYASTIQALFGFLGPSLG